MKKKILKRLFSFFLILTILLSSALINVPEQVYAEVSLKSSDIQKYVLSKVNTNYPNGYCLKFVEECYQNLGAVRPYSCCASKSGNLFIRSNDRSNIPIGATVYFGKCGGGPCRSCGSSYYGHVGIYVGDGYFVHATGGKVQRTTIDSWANKYRGYGYCGNFNLVQDNPTHNCEDHAGQERWRVHVSSVLNIRSGPGTGYSKTGTLSNGTEVYITEKSDANGYTWGKLNTGKGWIALSGNADYVCGSINVGHNPDANMDEIYGDYGCIRMRGWAFDRDKADESLTIHVYIDGQFAGGFRAEKERSDINNAYGVGSNHGFNEVIDTDKVGQHTVAVYALNVGNGANTTLWNDTVYIKPKNGVNSIEDGTYIISSGVDGQMVMDINGASTDNGANVMINIYNGGENQKFEIRKCGDGKYQITAKHSRKCVTVANGSKENCANIEQNENAGSDSQKWILVDAGNGFYYIYDSNSGRCIDLKNAAATNGNNIQLYDSNQSPAQMWKFTPAMDKITISNLENTDKGVKVTWGKIANAESYIVLRKTTDTGWSILKQKITDTTYIDTTPKEGEKYYYTVCATCGLFSSAEYEENKCIIRETPLSVNLEKSSNEKLINGEKITLKANAYGGKGDYTYKFIIFNRTTDEWYNLTDFTSKSTYTWTANQTGVRNFFVDVKDKDGKIVRSAVQTVMVVKGFNVSATVTSDSVKPGQKVTITAKAKSGTSPYTYSYLIHNKDTDKWARLTSKFVKDISYTWTAGSAGHREFYVEVKDSTGKVVRSSAVAVNVVKTEVPLSIKAKTDTVETTVGKKVIIKAEATGGKGEYTYSYLIYNKDTDKWARLTPKFVKDASYTWTAGSAGRREFYVEVKDSTGKVVRSSAVAVNVVKAEESLGIKVKTDVSETTVGKQVTIKAETAGGKGEYTYSYLIYNKDTDKWARLTSKFVKDASYTWTAGSAGHREFYVEVKDSTGKVVRSSAVAVNVVKAEGALGIKVRTDVSETTVGKQVTIKAEATGGKGEYTYSYLIHNKDTDQWYRLTSEFVKDASYTWTAESAGQREFYVEVKDETGKAVRSVVAVVAVK